MRNLPGKRFVDANIFINWLKATPVIALKDEVAAMSGYILRGIEAGGGGSDHGHYQGRGRHLALKVQG